jgi:very-short-patch-repair endonuclease
MAAAKRSPDTLYPGNRNIIHRESRAQAKERNPGNVSPAERQFGEWLRQWGYEPTAQKAIGPYNVDLVVDRVGVEIYGGNWHYTGEAAARFTARTQYILREGFWLLIVWIDERRYPLQVPAIGEFVTLHQQATRLNTARGQYRVIRGSGERISSGGVTRCAVGDALPFRRERGKSADRRSVSGKG